MSNANQNTSPAGPNPFSDPELEAYYQNKENWARFALVVFVTHIVAMIVCVLCNAPLVAFAFAVVSIAAIIGFFGTQVVMLMETNADISADGAETMREVSNILYFGTKYSRDAITRIVNEGTVRGH